MSEEETVVKDAPSQEPTEEVTASPSEEPQAPNEEPAALPASQEEMGRVIAGVKKKFREKGHREGLAEAQSRLSDEVGVDDIPPSAPQSAPAAQAPPVVDPMWANKAQAIQAQGQAKYEDFDEQFTKAAEKAQGNPTLWQLYHYAIGVGDVQSVYDIMTNPQKRAKMLEDPKCWQRELFKRSSDPESPKSPPPPLDTLKTTPAKGERTFAEQRRWALTNNKCLRN